MLPKDRRTLRSVSGHTHICFYPVRPKVDVAANLTLSFRALRSTFHELSVKPPIVHSEAWSSVGKPLLPARARASIFPSTSSMALVANGACKVWYLRLMSHNKLNDVRVDEPQKSHKY
jgi:hypothetical protein